MSVRRQAPSFHWLHFNKFNIKRFNKNGGMYDLASQRKLFMKQLIILLFVALICKPVLAQYSKGDKILRTNFEISLGSHRNQVYVLNNPTSEATTKGFAASFGGFYGSMRSSNTALLYGLDLTIAAEKSEDENGDVAKGRSIGVNPIVSLQKFYQVAPNLYYMPQASFGLSYKRTRSSSPGYPANDEISTQKSLGIGVTPFSVGFQVKSRMMILFNVGRGSLSYSSYEAGRQNSDRRVDNNGVVLAFNSNSFSTGLIFKLN